MGRSRWKGCFLSVGLKGRLPSLKGVTPRLKLCNRNSVISNIFIGVKVLVHTGISFKSFSVTREHVGYKFGCFALTRKFTVKDKAKLLKSKAKKK